MIPRDIDFSTKQESNSNNNGDDTKTTPTTTTSWSRLKDPRIVRVSRALGGKDRHSKVCTVRGLRDRRVRLSVPTAIQLYDLQERLGLNQPSKVVDWLLDAAKHEIDELPPLQIPQGIMMLNSHHHFSSDYTKQGSAAGKTIKDDDDHHHHHHHHQSWAARNNGEEEREDEEERLEVETTNFQQNPSSFTSLMSSSSSSSSFGRWDPSSLSLSSHAHHDQDLQSFNAVYQSAGMITQPYFAPQIAPPTNAAFHHHHHHHHHSTARPTFNFNMAVDRRDDQSKRHDLHSS